MNYINVKEAAKKWNVSERSVRNYCADGKISGAVCQGKVWKIPEDAIKPLRKQRAGKVSKDLLTRLQMEKEAGISGGIYHKVQIELMASSPCLNRDQDRGWVASGPYQLRSKFG